MDYVHDPKRVELDDSVEYLFGFLFGARAGIELDSRTCGLAEWRKDLIRAFKAIDTALDLNLGNADGRLRRDLTELVRITTEELKHQTVKDKLHTHAIITGSSKH